MFGLFKRDPTRKLTRTIAKMQADSVQVQRSGNLRKYAEIMTQIAKLEQELTALQEARAD